MPRTALRLRFHCPHCPAHIDWNAPAPATRTVDCPTCRKTIALAGEPPATGDGPLDGCPVCGGSELYVRKDFPQGVGLGVVALAAVLSFWFLESHCFLAWGFLLAAVAVDLLLYRLVSFVTVCYRCRAEIRGVARNTAHAAFDLATAEKYGVG
ncbi:MAG: hypothetical protein CHACPFDD_02684 [Phycisphaerae bacterium]|nr:hypothetical protein [Phycisphaerae bacterium]